MDHDGKALRTRDVARFFGVDGKTVSRWVSTGKILSFRTPGGHLRFDADYIAGLIREGREGRGSR